MADEKYGVVSMSGGYMNNIIDGERLRAVQSKVLKDLSNAIIHSMGPAGSNSLILRGNSDADIVAEYSKDGNKLIKSIKYQYPIEMAIKSEIENATRYIEKTVGDGTSSVVVMANSVFESLLEYENDGCLPNNPYETMRNFQSAINELTKKIREKGRECTLEDIYNIAYISTNGNEFISDTLHDIYEQYGMDVFIDVAASSDENTYVKSYNGITLEAGYSDPCMINNVERHSARIRGLNGNPVRIYQFQDPVDTAEMSQYFQAIIEKNIMEKRFSKNHYPEPEIPTVILAPTISRDCQAYMRRIVQMMHNFGEAEYSQKPQLLVVTNYSGLNENFMDHISQLCDCKPIRKYIDEEKQKADQEIGLAPTIDNICDFCGYAAEVESDANITRFIDPILMYKKNEDGSVVLDEKGNPVMSKTYDSIVNFLNAEYKNAKETGEHAGVTGSLKRQLNAVKANMVELYVGGISISDRDSLRDLVEDAVLNCRSAAANGVGYGANVIGFNILAKSEYTKENHIMYGILYEAYKSTLTALYATKYNNPEKILDGILKMDGIPCNMNTAEYDGKVLTSIESEPMILETISKIITIMFTANQAILQAPVLSQYY